MSGEVVETSSSEILETTSDDSEQACSKRRLDQISYGIPFQFELFDVSVTFIAIKCCTRTACTQSPSDTDNPPEPPVLPCICHFLRNASVRYFIVLFLFEKFHVSRALL